MEREFLIKNGYDAVYLLDCLINDIKPQQQRIDEMNMDELYSLTMTVALIVAGLGLFACLVRAIKGPTTADRILSINMMGTVIIAMILILTIMLNEGYLADIALIYALLSFLAVVVLVRIFIALNRRRGDGDRNA